jgi:hypothetical protein
LKHSQNTEINFRKLIFFIMPALKNIKTIKHKVHDAVAAFIRTFNHEDGTKHLPRGWTLDTDRFPQPKDKQQKYKWIKAIELYESEDFYFKLTKDRGIGVFSKVEKNFGQCWINLSASLSERIPTKDDTSLSHSQHSKYRSIIRIDAESNREFTHTLWGPAAFINSRCDAHCNATTDIPLGQKRAYEKIIAIKKVDLDEEIFISYDLSYNPEDMACDFEDVNKTGRTRKSTHIYAPNNEHQIETRYIACEYYYYFNKIPDYADEKLKKLVAKHKINGTIPGMAEGLVNDPNLETEESSTHSDDFLTPPRKPTHSQKATKRKREMEKERKDHSNKKQKQSTIALPHKEGEQEQEQNLNASPIIYRPSSSTDTRYWTQSQKDAVQEIPEEPREYVHKEREDLLDLQLSSQQIAEEEIPDDYWQEETD